MHILAILQLMVLLTLANGAPVVATKIVGSHLALPLDFGSTFFDGRPLFGPSKTFRGIVVAVLAAAVGAPLMGLDPMVGITAAAAVIPTIGSRPIRGAPTAAARTATTMPRKVFDGPNSGRPSKNVDPKSRGSARWLPTIFVATTGAPFASVNSTINCRIAKM